MKSGDQIFSEVLQYRALCEGQDTRHNFSVADFNNVYELLKDRFRNIQIVVNEGPRSCWITVDIPAKSNIFIKATRRHCINCQILGMQKTIDRLLDFDFLDDGLRDELATKLVNDLNEFIGQHKAFNEDADHKLQLHLPDVKNFSTKLVPRV